MEADVSETNACEGGRQEKQQHERDTRFGTVSVKRSVTAGETVMAAGKIERIRRSFNCWLSLFRTRVKRSRACAQGGVNAMAQAAPLRRDRASGFRLGAGRPGIEVVFVRVFHESLEPVPEHGPASPSRIRFR